MPNNNIGLYTWAVVAVVAAAVILFAIAMVAVSRRRRSEQLQILFGPEYGRAIRLYGDRRRAEDALQNRRKRLNELGIHELSDAERDRFLMQWVGIQAASPNDPGSTLLRADALLTEIMRTEGCPAEDPDERKVDLALMHPLVAEDYRVSSTTIDRQRMGLATSEECRRALIRFSNIFDSILGESDLRKRLRKVS
jgi:hypothetical protein